MPEDCGSLIRRPNWSETRARPLPLLLVRVTSTHSPAATCRASGSGALVPAWTAAASAVGTKAFRPPFGPLGTLTALTANLCTGADVGQGLPGSVVAGGRPPVLACSVAGLFAGTA